MGDTVIVKPNERLAADGFIVKGDGNRSRVGFWFRLLFGLQRVLFWVATRGLVSWRNELP